MQQWAIYTRLSQDRDGGQTATDRQEQACRQFAAAKGWEVGDVYTDVDMSAYRRGVNRPDFQRLKADLGAGRWAGVLCWKVDRLVRNHRDFEDMWEACETSGAGLASATEPVDSSSELGMIVVRLLVSFARMESANISVRVKALNAAKARNGEGHVSGQRPFGLNREWTALVDAEADLLRDAAKQVLAGESLNSIATRWNAAGVTTSTGKPWRAPILGRLLRAPHLAGLRVHNGEVIGPGSWPAVFDEVTHRRLVALLSDPARRRNGGGRARYLLSGGLLRCELCRHPMTSRPRADGARRYICRRGPGLPGCGKVGILAEPLEDLIREDVLNLLADGGVEHALADAATVEPQRQAAAQQLAAVEASMEQLAIKFFAEHAIGAKEYWAARRHLEEQQTALSQRLRGLQRSDPLAGLPDTLEALQEEWASWDIGRRRTVISGVVSEITVAPAVPGLNRFDRRRVNYTGLRA